MSRGAALALIALAGCGGQVGAAIPAGARVVGRGTLGYAVAFGEGVLATIELDDSFGLFVRDPDSGATQIRWELGPPERDLVALAIADGAAWVGGTDRQVRAIALDTGATRTTWPIGAAVTALAIVPGGWIAVGDAEGALCLRRRDDGALVQCVVIGASPVTAIERSGPRLVATVAGSRVGLAVPTLAAARAGPPPPSAVVGDAVIVGGRAVVRFAGPARAVAAGPRGQRVAVGWIRALGDPSVVVIPPDRVQSTR